jgi:Ca2+-binding EF-hand superfamily protein
MANMTRRKLLIAAMGASAIALGQKGATTAPADKFALANRDVEELLLLMDADKNGKISKHEWMSFMEAEFNRLDTNGSGELDLTELRQSRLRKSNS